MTHNQEEKQPIERSGSDTDDRVSRKGVRLLLKRDFVCQEGRGKHNAEEMWEILIKKTNRTGGCKNMSRINITHYRTERNRMLED